MTRRRRRWDPVPFWTGLAIICLFWAIADAIEAASGLNVSPWPASWSSVIEIFAVAAFCIWRATKSLPKEVR